MTQPEDLLENLNPPQREAVLTTEGPTLIIAGPGSGKTRVITHRIAHLARNLGIDPRSILAMTFTNKAANEMAQRAAKLAGEYERNARVSTFHSFCARTLRTHGEPVGLRRNYLIYDEDDQIAAIRECIEQHGWTKYNPRDLQTQISHAKSNLMGPGDIRPAVKQWESELLLTVYRTYERMLRRNNAVDFDDLILLTVKLFRESPPVLRQYQETYRYLMVDEFQDTNPAQYEMAKLLTTASRNFCAVGDPDQAIYSWRNADVRNIRSFQTDHPEVKTITLGQNYRSTSNIVEVSKRLIEWNRRPVQNELFTENPSGDPVAAVNYDDERQEARAIIEEVSRLTSQEGYKLQECAVLYRTNACSQLIEEACLDQGMRYRIVGGIQFYRRKEIKSLTAYLKLIYNENDNVNLLRVINTPSRGLGPKSIEQLAGWAALQEVPVYTAVTRLAQGETPPPGMSRKALNSIRGFAQTVETLKEASTASTMKDLVGQVIKTTGLGPSYQLGKDEKDQERLDNLNAFQATADSLAPGNAGEGLETLLEHVSLITDTDQYNEADDALTLITLHQAKGLEFPVVFIIGMEQGLLPHVRSMEDDAQIEEERRICYVGITRAMKRLYLSRSIEARRFRPSANERGRNRTEPSMFSREIASKRQTRDGTEEDGPRQLMIVPGEIPMKYRENDVVWKVAGSGSIGTGSYAMIADDGQGDPTPCELDCGNESCIEWSALWLVDGETIEQAHSYAEGGQFTGAAYRVNECQLLPDRPEEKQGRRN